MANSGTVYKLNLDTLVAEPLNNPQYDNFFGYFWYFDNQKNAVFALPYPDNKILISDFEDSYILDLDAIIPPQEFNGPNIYGYPLGTAYPGGLNVSNKLPIFSANGSFHSFEISGNNINVYLNGEFIESLAGATISSNNNMLGIDVRYAYDMDDMYIYKSGILFSSLNSDGTLKYEYQAKDLEFLFEDNASYYYKNGTVYCHNGNSFKKANPLSDDNYSIIYTSQRTVKSSWMMDEHIYFSAYNTATSVSTYVIYKGETEAIQISTSEMEKMNIIEFTF